MCRQEVFNMGHSMVNALFKVNAAQNKRFKPTSVEPAVVISVDPFRIRLKDNSKLALDRNMMMVSTQINDLIIDGRLKSGNDVLVIINRGGDDVYVIDRIT